MSNASLHKEIFVQLQKIRFLSFPRKRESSISLGFWIYPDNLKVTRGHKPGQARNDRKVSVAHCTGVLHHYNLVISTGGRYLFYMQKLLRFLIALLLEMTRREICKDSVSLRAAFQTEWQSVFSKPGLLKVTFCILLVSNIFTITKKL